MSTIMEILMFTLIATLCVAVSFLLAPACASHHQENVEQNGKHAQFTLLLLPRKLLKLNEEINIVKSFAEKDFMKHKKLMEASSGNKIQKKENVKHAEEKEPNKSEYVTMDYHWVRKRRPIHNKQVPFIP